jgi:hypothetical protein
LDLDTNGTLKNKEDRRIFVEGLALVVSIVHPKIKAKEL